MRCRSALRRVWVCALLAGLRLAAQERPADVLADGDVELSHPGERAGAVERIRAGEEARKQEARTEAQSAGWPERVEQPGGRLMELMAVENGRPLYEATHNANAAISGAVTPLQAAPWGLSGSGFTIGLWDGGDARATHQELAGRVTVVDNAGVADHSTHVAGTLAAAGVVAAAKGMAPGAAIVSHDWNNDMAEMTALGATYPGEAGKIHVSNHSYGYVAGWNYTGSASPEWTWYGSGTGTTGTDPDFGRYSTYARDSDALAVSAPYYLMFRSAGNDRLDNPAEGDAVSLSTSTTGTVVTYSAASHPAGDGDYKSGYDTIAYDAVAKNVVTVGSVSDAVAGGVRSVAAAKISSWSSWGPTDDGRIKPDLVANGDGLYSALSGSDTSYGSMSGTSMASPAAAGAAQLLVELFDRRFPRRAMRASTLKALLIHTADDLGPAGPDYSYGWGLVDAEAAAEVIAGYADHPGRTAMIEERLTTAVSTRTHPFTWDGSSPIRVTLAWTDPAGTAVNTSDSRSARLVNDLDVTLTGPDGTVYRPYVMPYVGTWTSGNFAAAAVTGTNHVDNVERIDVAAPGAAGIYTVQVDTSTASLSGGLQVYSLIVTGGAETDAAAAPVIAAVSPVSAASGEVVMTLTGSGFRLGGALKLVKAGQTDGVAYGVEALGDTLKARVDVTGLAAGDWDVVVTNPDGQEATLAGGFTVVDAVWQEDCESGASGWTHSASGGSSTWALSTTKSYSATHAFYGGASSRNVIDTLISPAIAVPAGATGLRLTFWQLCNLSSGRAGGVLEFTVDGGTWTDVTAGGSGMSVVSGGYSTTLSSSNPLGARSAWGGSSSAFSQVVIALDDAGSFAGHSLQLRWRLGSQSGGGGGGSGGWYIDDIVLSGASASANLAPTITADASAAEATVAGDTVALGVAASDDGGADALSYTWSVVGGTFQRAVQFSVNGTAQANDTTATFAAAGDYTFTVTVRDAEGASATSSVAVTVAATPTAVTVAPTEATVTLDGTQAFAAEVTDQFGDAIADAAVSWSVDGGGTIDGAGVFTATAVGGPFGVAATAGGATGGAAVNVIKKTATVVLSALRQTYDGGTRSVVVTTEPADLAVTVTYDGVAAVPSDYGSYLVEATVNDASYEGAAAGTLVITGATYDEWTGRWFDAAAIGVGSAGDMADPDGDGLVNLVEYALGTDPLTPTVEPWMVATDADGRLRLLFSRPRALPDVVYAAEASGDLESWTGVDLSTTAATGADATMEIEEADYTPATGDRAFLRLRIARP